MSDFSILGFCAKLGELAIATDEVAKESLTRAAKIVHRQAQSELGEYQGSIGPFVGWKELADSTQALRERAGFPPNEPLLVTGSLRDTIEYTVITDHRGGGFAEVGSDDPIAEWQELGTDRIPPRSFLGTALMHKAEKVVAIIGASTYGALVGEPVAERGFSGENKLISGGKVMDGSDFVDSSMSLTSGSLASGALVPR